MTALAASRNTPEMQSSRLFPMGAAASAALYKGGLVADIGGYAKMATSTATTGVLIIGVACEDCDNATGSAGAKSLTVKAGIFKFNNSSSGDAIATANVGEDCYVVDDNTVAKTTNSGVRARAGVVVQVDSDGVWVAVGRLDRTNPRTQTGIATMTAGTVTVSNVKLTASSIIQATRNTTGGTVGHLSVPAASRSTTDGTFVISSSTNADTSTVDWVILG